MKLSESATVHEVPVLRVSGDVDLSSSDELRAATQTLLARRPGLIVIDLSEVTFFDSAGLKVLDDVQQQAAGVDGRIALVCPQSRIVRLFEITGLTERFPIHASAESAVTAKSAATAESDDA